jgi:hypothetical protein
VRSCGICGGQRGTGTGFLRVLRFPLPNFIPSTAPQSPSSIIWGWYNRPLVVAVSSGPSLAQLIIIIIIIITTIIIIIIIIINEELLGHAARYFLLHLCLLFFLPNYNFKQTVQSSHQGMEHGFGHENTANLGKGLTKIILL